MPVDVPVTRPILRIPPMLNFSPVRWRPMRTGSLPGISTSRTPESSSRPRSCPSHNSRRSSVTQSLDPPTADLKTSHLWITPPWLTGKWDRCREPMYETLACVRVTHVSTRSLVADPATPTIRAATEDTVVCWGHTASVRFRDTQTQMGPARDHSIENRHAGGGVSDDCPSLQSAVVRQTRHDGEQDLCGGHLSTAPVSDL